MPQISESQIQLQAKLTRTAFNVGHFGFLVLPRTYRRVKEAAKVVVERGNRSTGLTKETGLRSNNDRHITKVRDTATPEAESPLRGRF